jgi:glyoxylase-like metal-dependent hydrolase (beta-lactamase superfamily II)
MATAGALSVRGVEARGTLVPGEPLDVPGRLVPVYSPGHTYGHCGFTLPGSGILFSGDALVTLDPYTGETGPRIVAKAATADSETALASLGALEATGAQTVLPGHGEPWQGGIASAAAAARGVGVA